VTETTHRPHAVPLFVKRQLEHPPIGPNEDADEFRSLFQDLSRSENDMDRTAADYTMVLQATTLTFRVIGLERVAQAMTAHKRPQAIVALIRDTGDDGPAEPGSLAFYATGEERMKYVGLKEARQKFDLQFEAHGYGSNAVEIEAFELALPLLGKILAQINTAQKQLIAFLKELERRDSRRAGTMRKTALGAISRAVGSY
jgi:hypothetical protein